MLEQPNSLLVNQLVYHVAEDGADGIEALVRLANVRQPKVIEEDLLNDEDGDRLAKFRPGFHDTQTERNDLGGKKKIHNFGRVVLDEGADDSKRCEAEVLEWSRLRGRVEKRIQEERQMSAEKEWSRLGVRCHTLQQRQCITDPVRRCSRQLGWVEEWVDRDDLLEEYRHDTEGVPDDQGQFGDLFALLAKFEQGGFASSGNEELSNPFEDPPVVVIRELIGRRRIVDSSQMRVHLV